MADDHIRYDLLTQEALRGVVRRVLSDVAKSGLPGDHHFYISFKTGAEGVRISPRLREQYPDDITIILQHQFWDMKVNDDSFEIGLSFGGVPEKLVVPFSAISGFFDPSVQFGLQFETVEENAGDETTDAGKMPPTKSGAAGAAAAAGNRAGQDASSSDEPSDTPPGGKPDNASGAEIVRLDRFRKK